MKRTFTCADCKETFDTTSSQGRLPVRCVLCKSKRQGGTNGGKSSIKTETLEKYNDLHKQVDRTKPGRSIQHQERAIKALAMRRDRHTWETIAQACGYSGRAAAYLAAKAEMARRQTTINETIDELRAQEFEHLEMLSREALQVLHKAHLVVNAGRVVYHGPEGMETPMIDDKPTLDAIATLLKVGEARRKLLGLDAASKAEVAMQVQFTVQGIPEGEMP